MVIFWQLEKVGYCKCKNPAHASGVFKASNNTNVALAAGKCTAIYLQHTHTHTQHYTTSVRCALKIPALYINIHTLHNSENTYNLFNVLHNALRFALYSHQGCVPDRAVLS